MQMVLRPIVRRLTSTLASHIEERYHQIGVRPKLAYLNFPSSSAAHHQLNITKSDITQLGRSNI